MDLTEAQVVCPYCWQTLSVFIDPSVAEQDYVEDCQVCCQPIQIHYRLTDQGAIDWLDATKENE